MARTTTIKRYLPSFLLCYIQAVPSFREQAAYFKSDPMRSNEILCKFSELRYDNQILIERKICTEANE
jgi:hypothetical protein